jgi:hypothetical protein
MADPPKTVPVAPGLQGQSRVPQTPPFNPINVAFFTLGDPRGRITNTQRFQKAAEELVGPSGKVLSAPTIEAAGQAIQTAFPLTSSNRIGKIFFVGHGTEGQYFFNGRVPATAGDDFDFATADGEAGKQQIIWLLPPLSSWTVSFLQILERVLMPPDNGFVVEMGFIDCYSGAKLVDAVVGQLDADNATPSKYKVHVGGYVHKLRFVDTHDKATNALLNVVLGREVLPAENPDPLAQMSQSSTWIENKSDLSKPPPYGHDKTTK